MMRTAAADDKLLQIAIAHMPLTAEKFNATASTCCMHACHMPALYACPDSSTVKKTVGKACRPGIWLVFGSLQWLGPWV
jgi:hypothetical protein